MSESETEVTAKRVDTLVRGTLVNVMTGTLEDRPVAIDNGEIVALEERPADRVLEAEYVAPGLIDAHTHIELSMVTVPRFGDAMVPRGVTSVVHDPHEIANVLGSQGVRDFVADAKRTPLKSRLTVPSSVPASDVQDTGAAVDPDAVVALLESTDAVALGEVMDVPGVLDGDHSVHAKIEAARECGLPVDGHAPGVTGSRLQELAASIDTDHESITLEEAREKVDAGLRVSLREGSTSRNLDDLIDIVDAVDTRRLTLCTDGVDPIDAVDGNGVNGAVRKAIARGVDPVTAVELATINTAETYDLPFGRLKPGAPADLVLLDDLETWDVDCVLVDGVVDPTAETTDQPDSALATETVRFDPVDAVDLAIEYGDTGPATVRVAAAVGDLYTERMTAEVSVDSAPESAETGGVLVADTDADILPMTVIERHGGPGTIGRGFVHNLGLDRGAIGTSVAHDAHNCFVTGVTHDAMAHVANYLREIGGGIAVYDPAVDEFTTLRLPVAGILSNAPLEAVSAAFEGVRDAANDIGLSVPGGLLELTFLPLEVIPTYKLTNNGLVDVREGEFVDVVIG